MKCIPVFIVLMTPLTSALANEVFDVRTRTDVRKTSSATRGLVATTSAEFDGFKISLVTTASGKPLVPSEIRVSVDGHTAAVDQSLFGKVLNPQLREIEAIADSGIFGTFFNWYIPFGDRKRCTFRGTKVNERASLKIELDADGKISRVSIFDLCSA